MGFSGPKSAPPPRRRLAASDGCWRRCLPQREFLKFGPTGNGNCEVFADVREVRPGSILPA